MGWHFTTFTAMLNESEDTKIDIQLSGEIDNKTPEISSSQDSKSLFGGKMNLPVPISVSQPAIKEWFGRRKANIRPLGTFFNTNNFQVPPSAGRLSKRLYKNVDYFQSNYVMVFLGLVLYCLITSPLLIIVHAAFYNYDALDLAPGEDTEQLVGSIVEEV